ncbi:MAG: acetyltransferase [Deltaproteobacteria bacterium]|nr:MAG: acetyltransferase [Deltaproteobacteria bacterium]
MPGDLIVVGAGGHAKVVVATARAAGFRVAAIVDDAHERWGTILLGVAVSGPSEPMLQDPAAQVVLAIGDNAARRRRAAGARCCFASVVHPSAIIDPTVRLGAGSVVFAGAVIQPDTVLGPHAIVNTAASIDHDCVLGEAVHLAPGVRLAGNVTVGDEAFLGIGVVVIPGVSIGARTTVGAGAAVVHDLPAGVVAVGVPARVR